MIVTFERLLTDREHKGASWGDRNSLYFDLTGHFTGIDV